MLHIPINTLLAAPAIWRAGFELPSANASDWSLMMDLPVPFTCSESRLGDAEQWLERTRKLTFFPFLESLMCQEASSYVGNGLNAVLLENVGAPYFARGYQPAVIYWCLRALAESLRREFPDIEIGIQILAFSDDWAMDIACRCGLNFIRSESVLFEGIRPEGRTPNRGNLAKLYMNRQMLMAELDDDRTEPQVFVDIQKKHTVFPDELASLDIWLENILFQKLEGIIITGPTTGSPVRENDLRQTREAIDNAKSYMENTVGISLSPLLLVGSGVSVKNIPLCKKYADGVIVGSSLKKNGYWECPLDEDRLERFVDAWKE
jgi:uncharacterized protein